MADTQIYGTICTDIGNAAIANAVLTGTKVNFTQVAVGDANGTPYTPSSDMTELKHQVWSGAIASVEQDTEQSNRLILRAVIPSSVGGWAMREIGVLDDQGRLIAIGNTPEIPKEVVTTGAVMEMEIAIYISVVDARGVNIVIDPTVVIASKADVNKVNNTLNTHIADTVSHMTAEEKDRLAAAVPNTRKINGHALTEDFDLTAKDVGASNPNLLINCNFRAPINQRGQSSYSVNNKYSIDRWLFVTPSEGHVDVNPNYITLNCSGANQNALLCQRLERYEDGINYLSGKTLTTSIRYRTTSAAEVYAYYRTTDNVNGEIIKNVVLVNDGLWHTLSFTFDVPTVTNINRLETSTVNVNNEGSVDIEWIKSEIGSVATPFSPRPYAEELALCQRYYEVQNNVIYMIGAHGLRQTTIFATPKRIVPSMTFKSPNGTVGKIGRCSGNTWDDIDYVPTQEVEKDHYVVQRDDNDSPNFFGWTAIADAEIY